MELSYLIERLAFTLDKLIFVNNLICNSDTESNQTLHTLTDEIKRLEAVYLQVKDELKTII